MVRLALTAIVACAALGMGCATTTKIVSEPPGAEVFEVDAAAAKDAKAAGKAIGKTPMSYEFKGWLWEAKQLKVSAPGYRPKTVEVKRAEVVARVKSPKADAIRSAAKSVSAPGATLENMSGVTCLPGRSWR